MSLLEQLAQIENPTPLFKDPEDELDLDATAKLVDFNDENDDADSDFDQPKSALRLRNATLLADLDSRYAGKKTSRRQLQKVALGDSYKNTQIGEGTIDDESDNESSVIGDRDDPGHSLDGDNDEESEEDEEHALNEFRAQLKKSALKKVEEDLSNEDEDKEDLSDEDEEEEEDNEVDGVEDDDEVGDKDDNDAEEDDDDDDEDGDLSEESGEDEDSHMDIDNIEDKQLSSNALGAIQTFSKMNLNEDADRGAAVKSQLRLWDALLECRIKLQKVLLNANQLPQHDVWSLFSKQGGHNYDKEAQSSQQNIKSLLDAFIELQALLLSKNMETKKMFRMGKANKPNEESDEEIPSDTEDEADTGSDAGEEISLKRKLKVAEYPEFLKKRHMDLEYFRNNTIQKWNDKTKISSGKVNKSFSSFEQSALKQIEQILQDEHRLVQRTQLKRSSYELLGKDFTLDIENGQGQTVSGQEAVLKQDFHLKDYDAEIFDDNDFYHQLLRELIERKTADVQDPVVLGRQWLEIQRMRSKMKRKTDTRASKGRKIRYDVQPKLVNFMAPLDECTMTEESRKDLFNSLFGRKWQDPENVTAV